jgi:hypothetical protein
VPRHDEPHSSLNREHVKGVLQLGQELAGVERSRVDPAAARLEARNVEQLLDQTPKGARLRLQRSRDLPLLRRQLAVDGVLK